MYAEGDAKKWLVLAGLYLIKEEINSSVEGRMVCSLLLWFHHL
jgi:hypothetical protein